MVGQTAGTQQVGASGMASPDAAASNSGGQTAAVANPQQFAMTQMVPQGVWFYCCATTPKGEGEGAQELENQKQTDTQPCHGKSQTSGKKQNLAEEEAKWDPYLGVGGAEVEHQAEEKARALEPIQQQVEVEHQAEEKARAHEAAQQRFEAGHTSEELTCIEEVAKLYAEDQRQAEEKVHAQEKHDAKQTPLSDVEKASIYRSLIHDVYQRCNPSKLGKALAYLMFNSVLML